jgi:hypothetical protein
LEEKGASRKESGSVGRNGKPGRIGNRREREAEQEGKRIGRREQEADWSRDERHKERRYGR